MNSIQVVRIGALSVLVVFLFLDLFVPIMRLLGILLMHTYNDVLYVFYITLFWEEGLSRCTPVVYMIMTNCALYCFITVIKSLSKEVNCLLKKSIIFFD